MCRPLPEQARSHRGSAADTDFALAHDQNCRSEPAGDGGVSGDAHATCAGLFPSRLGPTGDLRRTQNLRSTAIQTVGASLLAMAVCQAMLMPHVPASSRAGSVLQGLMVNTEFAFDRLCRNWLASEGGVSGDAHAACTGLFPSSGTPPGLVPQGISSYACRRCLARVMAVSSIMSSWPPTMPRRPISTRISRADTPYFFSARLANSRNEP